MKTAPDGPKVGWIIVREAARAAEIDVDLIFTGAFWAAMARIR